MTIDYQTFKSTYGLELFMDEVDVRLLKMLKQNARATYRELAEKVGFSSNAVFKRIQSLFDLGIIQKIKAYPSIHSINRVMLRVFCNAPTFPTEELCATIGNSIFTREIYIGSGNRLIITAEIRNINELNGYIDFLQNDRKLFDLTVGIMNYFKEEEYVPIPYRLSRTDLEIIKSLQIDARKRISTIGDEVGVTYKTVKRRLETMLTNKSLAWDYNLVLDASNDIFTIFEITLQPGIDKYELFQDIEKKFGQYIFFQINYSNLPNLISIGLWTATTHDLNELIRTQFNRIEFKSVLPHVLITARYYDCWLDHLVDEVKKRD